MIARAGTIESDGKTIHHRNGQRTYTPEPTDIRAGCLEVQETWSERERRTRAGHVGGVIPGVETQFICVSTLLQDDEANIDSLGDIFDDEISIVD